VRSMYPNERILPQASLWQHVRWRLFKNMKVTALRDDLGIPRTRFGWYA
jgi:hypothetical protein